MTVVSLLVFICSLIIVLSFYLKLFDVSRAVWKVAFLSFALRAGYVFVDSVVGIYDGGGDEYGYDVTIWFVAQQWRSGVLLAPFNYGMSPGNSGGYMFLYSTLFSPAYTIFGHISEIGRLQMALFGAFVVVNIYLITEYIYNHRAGLIAGLITAIFPYWIILSAILYRDMLVIFFFTLMSYYFVRWQRGRHQPAVLASLIGSALLGLSLRTVNIVALGAILAITAFIRLNRVSSKGAGATTAGLGTLVTVYIIVGQELFLSELAGRRGWLARESPGAYLSDVIYQSYVELIAFHPIGSMYFLLTPFPWHLIDLMAMIAIAQNLFLWYPIVMLSVIGFRDSLHVPDGSRMVIPLVGFSIAGVFAYGLVEGNIGPAMRHRSQFQFIFFTLTGIALSKRVKTE
jgi:hypothetical protein